MTDFRLTRRTAFLAGASLPFVGALAPAAHAAAGMLGAAQAPFHRFKLGDFEVTALLAGTRVSDKPQETFGLNATPDEFKSLAEANFLPADKTRNFFTPTLVNTGTELVLFDTGLAPEGITSALAAAGYTPDQVDVVVLTHMHGDHIGGLMGADGTTSTFANARYVTGAAEHNHWSGAANEGFDKNVRPLNDKFTFLDDGGAVVSGITAMAAMKDFLATGEDITR